MDRSTLALSICCLAAASMVGCGGSSKPHAGAMPDMKEMEKAMMEAGTPGPMQKWLTDGAGTWQGKCKMWMDPSAPPEESACTTTITPAMDGRFVHNQTRGSMTGMDGKPMNFEGFGVIGYNNTSGKFETNWSDSMGTMQLNYVGTLSSDKTTLTSTTHFYCPVQKKNTWMRNVEKHTGPNSMTLTMYSPRMMDGKEAKIMEIEYTRSSR